MYVCGLTFNSSENERDKLITVQVTIDNRQSLGFTITTNKNMVTIQELDYKARHWLTKEKSYTSLMVLHLNLDI